MASVKLRPFRGGRHALFLPILTAFALSGCGAALRSSPRRLQASARCAQALPVSDEWTAPAVVAVLDCFFFEGDSGLEPEDVKFTTSWLRDWSRSPRLRDQAVAGLEGLPLSLGSLLAAPISQNLARKHRFSELVPHLRVLTASLVDDGGDLYVALRRLLVEIAREPRLRPADGLLPKDLLESSARLLGPDKRHALQLTLGVLEDLAPLADVQHALGTLAGEFRCRNGGGQTRSPLTMTLKAVSAAPDRPERFFHEFTQGYALWVATCDPEGGPSDADVQVLLRLMARRYDDFAAAGALTEVPGLVQDLGEFLRHSSQRALEIDPTGQTSWLRMLSDSGLLRAISKRVDTSPPLVSALFKLLRTPEPATDFFLSALGFLETADVEPFRRFIAHQGSEEFLEEWGRIFDKVGPERLERFGRSVENGQLRSLATLLREWARLGNAASTHEWAPTATIPGRHENELDLLSGSAPGADCFNRGSHPVNTASNTVSTLRCLARSGVLLPLDEKGLADPDFAALLGDLGSTDPWFRMAPQLLQWTRSPGFRPLSDLDSRSRRALFRDLPLKEMVLSMALGARLPESAWASLRDDIRSALTRGFGFPQAPHTRAVGQELESRISIGDFSDPRWFKFRARAVDSLVSWSRRDDAAAAWKALARLSRSSRGSRITLATEGQPLRFESLGGLELLDWLLWELRPQAGDPALFRAVIENELDRLLRSVDGPSVLSWVSTASKRLRLADLVVRLPGYERCRRRIENAQILLEALIEHAPPADVAHVVRLIRALSGSRASDEDRRSLLLSLHAVGAFRVGIRLLNEIPDLTDPRIGLRFLSTGFERFARPLFESLAQRLNPESEWRLSRLNLRSDGRLYVGAAALVLAQWRRGSPDPLAWLAQVADTLMIPWLAGTRGGGPEARIPTLSQLPRLAASLPEARLLQALSETCASRARNPASVRFLSRLETPEARERLMDWLESGAASRLLEWSALVRPGE